MLFIHCFLLLPFASMVSSKTVPVETTDPLGFLEWWQRNLEIQDPSETSSSMKSSRFQRKFDPKECELSSEVREEIWNHRQEIDLITKAATEGNFKGKTFQDLAFFVDSFGPRVSGSDNLEKALAFLQEEMVKSDLKNVHSTDATVPKWIRGNESAVMLSPRRKTLQVKGLGFTVPTPPEGILAEVIVIDSFKDMARKKDSIMGKIVVYNSKNGEGPMHCLVGAAYAAKYGALGALARSATGFSLYSGHTGVQFYDEKYPKIPVASLTLEDADMITRMYERGDKVTIHLQMDNVMNTEAVSRNVFGDLPGKGNEVEEEFVLISGHADSWDVGEGAIDDGIGVTLALETVNLLRSLNLRPKRTIKVAGWTAEEAGLVGVRQWMKTNRDDMGKYSAAFEADYGCLKPNGLLFSGSPQTGCILQEILGLAGPPSGNATRLVESNGLYTDIYSFAQAGVPAIVMDGDDGKYFWYHHTEADAMTALQSKQLDNCLALWASVIYVVADLHEKLPR